MKDLKGFIAAPYTPLKSNGDLNVAYVETYYRYLKENDITGVFINGSTGDFTSLTIEERNLLTEKWCDVVDDDFITMVHVGHTSLKECEHMAEHAGKCGANIISTLPPFYFKPVSLDSLVSFCADVAIVNPDIPFLYYHIPSLTGVDFSMIDFLEKAKKQIPNLLGVKFTKPDLMDYRLTLDYDNRKYKVFFGVDEIMIASLALGGTGWIGSTYNHFAPLYHEIRQSFLHNNIEKAGELQQKAMKFVKIVHGYGWPGASKYVLRLIGIDCGPVRSPHHNLTESEKKGLESDLQEIGFFRYLESKQAIH